MQRRWFKYAIIVQNKNVDMLQEIEYLTELGMCTDQAVYLIESGRMWRNTGDTSRRERDSLGDENVWSEINQWEGGRTMN